MEPTKPTFQCSYAATRRCKLCGNRSTTHTSGINHYSTECSRPGLPTEAPTLVAPSITLPVGLIKIFAHDLQQSKQGAPRDTVWTARQAVTRDRYPDGTNGAHLQGHRPGGRRPEPRDEMTARKPDLSRTPASGRTRMPNPCVKDGAGHCTHPDDGSCSCRRPRWHTLAQRDSQRRLLSLILKDVLLHRMRSSVFRLS